MLRDGQLNGAMVMSREFGGWAVISERELQALVAPHAAPAKREPGVQALYQAAARLADMRRGAPKYKTRDLVGLLLSHGARTWRNSQPVTDVRLRVYTPAGKSALRISFGA